MPITGRTLFLAVATILAAGACSGGEDRPAGRADDTTAAASDTVNVLNRLSVVDVLHSEERFSAFVSALDTANLSSNLDQGGPFTIFVPPNEHFSGAAQSLFAAQNRDRLLDVLLYHVIEGNLTAAELRRRDSFQVGTLEGTPVSIYRRNGRFVVNDVPLVNTSVTVRNGTVYVLNGALTPPSDSTVQAPGTSARRSPSQGAPRSTPQSTPQSTPRNPSQNTPQGIPGNTPQP